MGVPGFIYWLVTNVIDSSSAKKEDNKKDQSTRIVYPIPTPKVEVQSVIKQQVDNFYIDLNGLIHPCCHPQIGRAPENEEQMMQRIIEELLILAKTVNPTNLFYIAVDGVAPAAKQEQQRHRRFVAISENEQKLNFFGKLQNFIETDENKELKRDKLVGILERKKKHWDHNVISPGTPFMMKCMNAVHRAAKLIATEYPHMKVIVSDSSIPGEGEHKILTYMKKEKAINSKKFSEMVHIVHGLDADLIMLTSLIGLPKMYSYRDSENRRKNCRDRELFYISELGRHFSRVIYSSISQLDQSAQKLAEKIEWSNESFVSDVVLLLMFVGNDFLPNVPSLVMHNHAASIIMYSYAKYLLQCMNQSGLGEKFDPKPHYLVDYSTSSMINVKNMIKAMGSIREESILGLFAKLYSSTIRAVQSLESSDVYENPEFIEEMKSCYSKSSLRDQKFEVLMKTLSKTSISHKPYNIVFKIVREHLSKGTGKFSDLNDQDLLKICFNRPANLVNNIDPALVLKHADEIHSEYYQKKFHDSTIQFRKNLVKEYLRGVVWSFNYYSYNEPPSWYWRYPEHYAPVLCDILDCLGEMNDEYLKEITTFEKGEPLTPYQQLVSILPKESMDVCLPKTFTDILSNPKLDEFFPKTFEKDGNFTGIAYKAVSLLPSIDIELIKNITKEIDPLLTIEEAKKNKFGFDVIYTAVDSDINAKLKDIKEQQHEERFSEKSILSGVFSKIDQSEMVFGVESVQEELKAAVCAYKFCYPDVPIKDAYKYVVGHPIPKTKLISTLTRQLSSFNTLGGFVTMSEGQDLSSLGPKTPRRNESSSGKRTADRYEGGRGRDSDRPNKASKRYENQRTPVGKFGPFNSSNSSRRDDYDRPISDRRPIRASNDRRGGNNDNRRNNDRHDDRNDRDERRGTKRSSEPQTSDKKESTAEPNTKQQKNENPQPPKEKETTSSTTSSTTTPANNEDTKRKRKRNRQRNKKPNTPASGASSSTASASNTTATTTTESTATPASAAPVDNKQKLKESTNAKFKALLGKFAKKD